MYKLVPRSTSRGTTGVCWTTTVGRRSDVGKGDVARRRKAPEPRFNSELIIKINSGLFQRNNLSAVSSVDCRCLIDTERPRRSSSFNMLSDNNNNDSNNQDMFILPVWLLLLILSLTILLPPLIATVYAIATVCFNNAWTERLPVPVSAILARLFLTMVATAATVVTVVILQQQKNQQQQQQQNGVSGTMFALVAFCLVAISMILLSAYWIRQTRIQMVHGGPPPKAAAVAAAALCSPDKGKKKHKKTSTTMSKEKNDNNDDETSPIKKHPDNNNNHKNNNKVYVITGANQGIGKETARALLLMHQQQQQHCSPNNKNNNNNNSNNNTTTKTIVVLACRNLDRAQAAANELRQELTTTGNNSNNNNNNNNNSVVAVDVVELDLSCLDSVRAAAQQILQKYTCIDVLINNAGLMMAQQQLVVTDAAADDHGRQQQHDLVLQSNHIGHFLWTNMLLPLLYKSNDPRIINVTSSTYTIAVSNALQEQQKQQQQQPLRYILPLHDLECTNGKRPYTMFGQYAVSKLCNIYFTAALQQRYYPTIWSAAVHPGLVRTDVTRNMPWYLRYPNQWAGCLVAPFQKTPAQGAWCTLHVATAPRDELLSASSSSTSSASCNRRCCSSSPQTTTTMPPLYWVNRKPQTLIEPLMKEWDGLVQEEIKALWDLTAKWTNLSPPPSPAATTKTKTTIAAAAAAAAATTTKTKANNTKNKNKAE